MSKLTFHPSASALCRGKVFDRIYVILKKILQEAALVILHFSQSLARTSDGFSFQIRVQRPPAKMTHFMSFC